MVEWGKGNGEGKKGENSPKSDISALFSSTFFFCEGQDRTHLVSETHFFSWLFLYMQSQTGSFQTSERVVLEQESAKYSDIMQTM